MNFYRISCLFLLCILNIQAYSQKDVRPGYILLAKDTLKGFVQYREGKSGLLKCSFRKTQDGQPTAYSPEEIAGFGFEGRHFMPLKIDATLQFAELIVDGRASLLRILDIYYIKKDSAIVSLKSVQREVFDDGKRYLVEDRTFAGQLTVLFSDCQDKELLTKKIKNTHLDRTQSEKEFKNIVTTYNSCMGSASKFYTLSKAKKALTFGVYGEISKGFSSVSSTEFSLDAAEFNSAPQFTGGIFIDGVNPRISEKLHVRLEVSYLHSLFNGNYKTVGGDEVTFRVEYSGIKIPVSVSYSFSTGNFIPYIRTGISPSFLFATEFKRKVHFAAGFVNETEPYELRSAILPIFAGAGFEKKIKSRYFLFAELRYTLPADILNNYMAHSFKTSALDFLVGIRL